MDDLRYYTFINFYLSSIQQGIQSAHVISDMFVKYKNTPEMLDRVYDWAENHKVLITLNGGANEDIQNTYTQLDKLSHKVSWILPVASFNEDEKSLGGVMTGCGVVLPQWIYEAIPAKNALYLNIPNIKEVNLESYVYIKDEQLMTEYVENSPEWELIKLVKSCPLAR